jgi:lauroyl/myristoyl acyltransferase
MKRTSRRERILRALEGGLYWVVIAPIAARLPAPLAYGLACRRGDWRYRHDSERRKRIMRGLTGVFGEQLSPAERASVTRDYFRMRSCEAIDALRLAGKGRALARLVEIRGREHLEAALAGGKGVILCGAHLGLYGICGALLGIAGFPVTIVGRWPSRCDQTMPRIERIIWRLTSERHIARHLHRPNIEPEPGQLGSAVQMAAILRQNEVIWVAADPPALNGDLARTVPVPFLGHEARLLPGSAVVAQLTGAPVLMVLLRRSADWRHQVLEISPPVLMDGDPVTAFSRCVALVDAAIRDNPAQWAYWARPDELVDLGLLPADAAASRSPSGTCVGR